MKTTVFMARNDLYPFTVVFIVGPRPSDKFVGSVCRRYKLWNGEDRTPTAGEGHAGTCNFHSGSCVWIEKMDFSPRSMEVLVHELFHVASNLSHTLGCYLDKNTDEFHAYYIGWVTKKFFARISKKP